MSRIKVTVKDLNQVNEIIDYWKDKDVELLIGVKPNGTLFGKENTTTENSDVKCFGTADNPVTKKEWNNKKNKAVHGSSI